MTTALVILARQGSTRLPLKHLYPLDRAGRNTFQLLSRRLSYLPTVGTRFVAIPHTDNLYRDLIEHFGFHVFSSPGLHQDDVLTRIHMLSLECPHDRYLIVHGDSPMMCPQLCGELLGTPNDNKYGAYFYDAGPGLRPRLIKKWALDTWVQWLETQQTQPLTALQHDLPFKVKTLKAKGPGQALTLDYPSDLMKLRSFIKEHSIEWRSK